MKFESFESFSNRFEYIFINKSIDIYKKVC